MSERKIAPVEINGKTVWIEMDDIQQVSPTSPDLGSHPTDLRGSATPVGPAQDYIKDKITNVTETLEAIVSTVDKGFEKIGPDEWAVELTIGFAGEKNIPFVAKGSAKGGVKISAKWKTTSDKKESVSKFRGFRTARMMR